MRKLIRIQRLLEEAEAQGVDVDSIVVDANRVHTIEEPDTLPFDEPEDD